jgi:hypothetical protein
MVALIKVSRPQNYYKQTFSGVAHWQFLLNELHSQKGQSAGFQSETASCKTPTNMTVDDVLPKLKLLNALTAYTLLFCLVRSFTAKEIYLNKAR